MGTIIKWFASVVLCIWFLAFIAIMCLGIFHLITPPSYHFLPDDQIKHFGPFLFLSIFILGALFFIYWCEWD